MAPFFGNNGSDNLLPVIKFKPVCSSRPGAAWRGRAGPWPGGDAQPIVFLRQGPRQGARWCSPLHGILVPTCRPRPGSLRWQHRAALSFPPPKFAGAARGVEPWRGRQASLQQWEEEELSLPGARPNPGFPTGPFLPADAGAGTCGAASGACRSPRHGTSLCARCTHAVCAAGTCLVLH